jgi:hypothetical protein
MTLYCARNQKDDFKVGMRAEKSRLRRSLASLQELMRKIRHHAISDQVGEINAFLRGHYALRCRRKFSVSRQGVPRRRALLASDGAQPQLGRTSPQLEHVQPDQRTDTVTETKAAPSVARSCRFWQCCESAAEERSAVNRHATFYGSRRRATASGDPVGEAARLPPVPINDPQDIRSE